MGLTQLLHQRLQPMCHTLAPNVHAGTLVVNTLQNGDVGLSPQGAAHYLKNNGNTPADVVLIFNADVNTGIDLSWTLGS